MTIECSSLLRELLYIGEPLEREAIVLQDGWCLLLGLSGRLLSTRNAGHLIEAWSLLSSIQGKDDRRVDMTKVVCRYRTNLPVGVETYPRCIRSDGLPKLPKKLCPFLITEHHLASGGTVELKYQFRLGIPKLVLDLLGHPIESSSYFLLISAREPDTRALRDLLLNGDGAIVLVYARNALHDVLFIFDVFGGFETQREC